MLAYAGCKLSAAAQAHSSHTPTLKWTHLSSMASPILLQELIKNENNDRCETLQR